VGDTVILQQVGDGDRAPRGEAAVRVDELGDAVAQCRRDDGDHLFGPVGPFVDVAAALGADPSLGRREATGVAQPA
jgi:hypothetical protein